MVERQELVSYIDELLGCGRFKDYCPNGLQVEGKEQIRKIVCGVTASRRVVEAARAHNADVLLVHHGYFWKGESPVIRGIKRDRIAALLCSEINLLAYHLPLDAHPELGNNAVWAHHMGWEIEGTFGEQDIAFVGHPKEPLTGSELAERLERVLGRRPLHITGDDRPIRRLAWCSGGAQAWFEAALAQEVDAFVTGEGSEPSYHLAKESGVHFFAAGHHATERFGVQALCGHLEKRFGVQWQFVDEPNPL